MLKIMSRARRQAGKQSKTYGEMTENLFASLCAKANIFTIQIPSGMRVRRGASGKLIPVPQQTPFDFILTHKELGAAFVDVKHTDNSRLPYSFITRHQAMILDRTQQDNIPSCYAVLFTSLEKPAWYAFSGKLLMSLRPRESLLPDQGLRLGPEFEADMTLIYKSLMR
jgi:hypothetical protein